MKVNLPDKMYYTTREVADAFGLNQSNIRYWERQFPILKPKRNKKGDRYFTQEDIKNLEMIYYLTKEKGYTLDGAKMALSTDEKLYQRKAMIDKLRFVKAELEKLKGSLSDNKY